MHYPKDIIDFWWLGNTAKDGFFTRQLDTMADNKEDDEEGKFLSLLDNTPKYLVDDEQEGNKYRVN